MGSIGIFITERETTETELKLATKDTDFFEKEISFLINTNFKLLPPERCGDGMKSL